MSKCLTLRTSNLAIPVAKIRNPTYEQVNAGGTGHAKAVRVNYDPTKVSYHQLLDYFWHHVDPTVQHRQFCDTGNR